MLEEMVPLPCSFQPHGEGLQTISPAVWQPYLLKIGFELTVAFSQLPLA